MRKRTFRQFQRMNRRNFLKLGGTSLAGAALLGGGTLAGCGGAEPQDGVVNITFSFGPDDSGTLEELVESFNREFEGEIQVEYRQFSRLTDEYFDEIAGELARELGDVDVIGGDVVWTAELARNGWIEDITGRMYRDYPQTVPDVFLEAAIASCSFRNRLWGTPWFSDAGLLYYRSDLLEEAGFSEPPRTWEELSEMAGEVQSNNDIRFGFVFQGDEYEGGVVNGCEFIWNAGGQLLTGTTSVPSTGTPPSLNPNVVAIDSPNSVRGLEIQRSLVSDGVAPEEVASYREEDSSDAFLAGDAVFMRGWPFMYALAEEQGSEIETGQIGVAPLPTADAERQSFSCLGGWNMLINSASENQDAAWEFIKFATAPEQQRTRALEGSFLPTLRELYQDEEVLESVPVIGLGREVIENNTRSRPVTPYYSEISAALAETFNENLRGEIEPEEAVESLQSELEDIVDRN